MNHLIVYCSPNGSTRHVARVMAKHLMKLGLSVTEFDLGREDDRQRIAAAIQEIAQPFCLWVGSPVYVDHMVPPVEYFLSSLPGMRQAFAVPFITWGAVNSGVALYEMGQKLEEKGFTVLGAAKVAAVHSSMWKSDQPLGAGRPDSDDDEMVQELVRLIQEKIATPEAKALPLESLNYQPLKIQQEAREKSIAKAKEIYPELAADDDKCSQCGECAQLCPAGAITMNPYPQFGEDCFLCLKCMRECPEDAIPFDTSAMEQRIRSMAAVVRETPLSQIFV